MILNKVREMVLIQKINYMKHEKIATLLLAGNRSFTYIFQ